MQLVTLQNICIWYVDVDNIIQGTDFYIIPVPCTVYIHTLYAEPAVLENATLIRSMDCMDPRENKNIIL